MTEEARAHAWDGTGTSVRAVWGTEFEVSFGYRAVVAKGDGEDSVTMVVNIDCTRLGHGYNFDSPPPPGGGCQIIGRHAIWLATRN